MQSTRARTAALHSLELAVHETYRSVMVTQRAICCTENYYPSEASSRQSSLPGRVGRRSGLDWSGIHRLVAAVESACRRGSYWRGACMCLDEKPAPILKSFAQAWHSWRNTPEASRAREISQQKEPGQIRLSKQIWDLKQRQGRGPNLRPVGLFFFGGELDV